MALWVSLGWEIWEIVSSAGSNALCPGKQRRSPRSAQVLTHFYLVSRC